MTTRLHHALSSLLFIAPLACAANPPVTSTDVTSHTVPAAAAPAPGTAILASFDPAAGELPEGIAMKDGFAYVGFAPLGEIAKVDLHNGTSARCAKLPKPVPGKGFMTGLTFGADGALYAALVSFDPSVQPGVYRIPASGGVATLFAKDAKMAFPNGLAFDAAGALFVTDSAAGTIFKVAPSGTVTPWASSALLVGDQTQCGGSGLPFPIGANGLAARNGAFYATNTDKGSIVRIDVAPDGTAGKPELAAGPDCAALAGADGITVDPRGDFVVAINRQNKVVRIAKSGAIDVIASGDAIEFPATVTWDAKRMIATNFALANASSGKPAKPGLVAITRHE